MIATIKLVAAVVLSAIAGYLIAVIIGIPAIRWFVSFVVGIIFCFISSTYICKKLGVVFVTGGYSIDAPRQQNVVPKPESE